MFTCMFSRENPMTSLEMMTSTKRCRLMIRWRTVCIERRK
ncbi:hypothetical protein AHF37_01460 [Paragonimus kellicotti]|nr:hypothetical protein AHF37_01460 [Paragonimus kellicotti]